MGRATQRRATAGLSLVELLVVLGMIGVISAVVVPVSIRSGWFGGSKSAFAARELFTILKAARVYASTHNVETAVAYGGAMAKDSELALDGSINACVPFADSVLFARRLKREELINYFLPANSLNIFVPLSSSDGAFRPLPKERVLLPDLFAVQNVGDLVTPDWVSSTGLEGIQLYDVNSQTFLGPRADGCDGSVTEGDVLDYALPGDTSLVTFPAHRFLPDGSLRTPENLPTQRFSFRVGARPDATYKERFFTNPDSDVLRVEAREIYFNADDATAPRQVFVGLDGDPATRDYAEITATIEIFKPTGRVKMLP